MSKIPDLQDRPFDRTALESLQKRRFFVGESFDIYRTAPNFTGDNRGLYDYGPPGCALQANIVNEWRNHFVIEENMLEVDCPIITPEDVLRTSGHVDKFSDWMCKDPVKGDFLRADHLIENVLQSRLEEGKAGDDKQTLDSETSEEYASVLAQIDNFDGQELGRLIEKYDIRNPNGGGKVLAPVAFNLMFQSTIGPSAAAPVYLRPETAQSQFLNFKRLLEHNQYTMPFASASVGKTYRNEIAPRSGLLRLREFLLAEIEHFVDPEKKTHERFFEVKDVILPLLDRETQLSGQSVVRRMSTEEAVRSKTVDNETLGYFLVRIYKFLCSLGVNATKIRFRQHMKNEMAHYASDCWDAELSTSYGWIECVGCADRSAYDLTVHTNRTNTQLIIKEQLATPISEEKWEATLEQKLIGPRFKKDAKKIQDAIELLDQQSLQRLAAEMKHNLVVSIPTEPLADGSKVVELDQQICRIDKVSRVKKVREYTPNVVEPSFGISRILYCVLEHVYWHRPEDTSRGVLSLPMAVAPTKVLIVPLSNNASLQPIAKNLSRRFRRLRIANNIDASSSSIGKRYARNDELGTPLGITIDFDTVKNGSLTLRDRDSMQQVRATEDEIVQAVQNLIDGHEQWEHVTKRLPAFTTQQRLDE